MKITLLGEPKSTQHCYKFVCRGAFPSMYMDKKCKDIKEGYQWEARSQYKGDPLEGPLKIEITLYFKTKRIVDWDNFHKLSMDALSGIVWQDDSQILDAVVHKRRDKENPRIEITVDNLEDENSVGV